MLTVQASYYESGLRHCRSWYDMVGKKSCSTCTCMKIYHIHVAAFPWVLKRALKVFKGIYLYFTLDIISINNYVIIPSGTSLCLLFVLMTIYACKFVCAFARVSSYTHTSTSIVYFSMFFFCVFITMQSTLFCCGQCGGAH